MAGRKPKIDKGYFTIPPWIKLIGSFPTSLSEKPKQRGKKKKPYGRT
jgi:hypothetical protein